MASDALALGNMAGSHPEGGAVVISGEDPWCDSTQVPADSRFLFEHLRMPVVEPGTPQELKDWINLSFKLSQAAGLYIGYIVTVAHADGGGTVDCQAESMAGDQHQSQDRAGHGEDSGAEDGASAAATWQKELQTDERFAATMKQARELGINRIIPAMQAGSSSQQDARPLNQLNLCSPLGLHRHRHGRAVSQHVLNDIGLLGHFPILQMGMSYPVDVRTGRASFPSFASR